MKRMTLVLVIMIFIIGCVDKILPGEQYIGRVALIRYVPVGNGDVLYDTLIVVNNKKFHVYGKLDIPGMSSAFVYYGIDKEGKKYLRFVGLNRIESVHLIWQGE